MSVCKFNNVNCRVCERMFERINKSTMCTECKMYRHRERRKIYNQTVYKNRTDKQKKEYITKLIDELGEPVDDDSIRCKDCNNVFIQQSRSKLCSDCRVSRFTKSQARLREKQKIKYNSTKKLSGKPRGRPKGSKNKVKKVNDDDDDSLIEIIEDKIIN